MKVCCFSGTKPHSIIWKYENSEVKFERLKELIRHKLAELIEQDHVTHFISGITIVEDLFTAEIVLELKETYHITLECVLLCADQVSYWQPDEQERYHSIARSADSVLALQENYTVECHKLLTEYLVNKGDFFMAIFRGMSGFTLDTITSAYTHGKCVFVINPNLVT